MKNKNDDIIRDKIKGKGYTGKLINYTEFLKIYEPYKNEMSEKNFADILGIPDLSYESIKYQGKRTKILKMAEVKEERKEKIRDKIREKGYTNKSIDYTEFLKLYKPYKKEMSEKDFASILGISASNYGHVKKYRRRAIILKTIEVKDDDIKEEISDN